MSTLEQRVVSRFIEAVSKDDAEEMAEFKRMIHEMTEEMLGFAEEMDRFKGKMGRWRDKLPKNALWEDVPNDLDGAISSMDKSVSKLRGYAHKLGT